MICPQCKNIGFEPTEDVKYPLQNLGGKQKYDTVDLRYYACNQCGYKFETQETFSRSLKAPPNNLQEHIPLNIG